MRTLIILARAILFLVLFQNLVLYVLCHYMKARSKQGKVLNVHDSEDRGIIHKAIFNCLSGFVIFSLTQLGRLPSNSIRKWCLKHVYCMDIGSNVSIHSNFTIRHPWNIRVGKGSVIGDYVYLDGRKGIVIGENVNISTGVCIWTMQHDINDPFFRVNDKIGAVTIGDRAWISCRAIILPKINIGNGAVIAAGAVVTNDCIDFTVYGGVPSKAISERNRNLIYEFKSEDGLWFV